MNIDTFQLIVFFAGLCGSIFAAFKGRVILAKMTVAAALTAIFLSQMFVTPLDKKIKRLSAAVTYLRKETPDWQKANAELAEAKAQSARVSREGKWYEKLPFNLGLDLRGGVEVRLALHGDDTRLRRLEKELLAKREEMAAAAAEKKGELTAEAVKLEKALADEKASFHENFKNAVEVVRVRLNNSGLAEIPVTMMGANRVLVQLPGMDTSRARQIIDTIQRQGKLEFRLANTNVRMIRAVEQEFGYEKDVRNICFEPMLRVVSPDEVDENGWRDRATKSPLYDWLRTPDVVKESGAVEKGKFHLVHKEPLLTGKHIIYARAEPNPESASFQISIALDSVGAAIFEHATAPHVKEPLAIVLDNQLKSAPIIQEALGAHFRITGDFDRYEAEQLAVVLKSGSLQVKSEKEYENAVGPTLGEDSIRHGVLAMAVGSAIVILFMLVYYRLAGVVAIIAISLNILIILYALSIFDATLTLPGLAGLALTVGMGVDANVLIYERLREEREKGNPLSRAIALGFERAFVTILDSNITTILIGLILYSFGTEAVRGFALTLIIGIAANIFTAVYVGRWFFDAIVASRLVDDIRMLQAFKRPQFNYLRWRRPAMAATFGFIAIGLAVVAWRGEHNYAQDFTGGTLAQISLQKALTMQQARQAVEKHLAKQYPDISVQSIGDSGTEFILRTKWVKPELAEETPAGGQARRTQEQFREDVRRAFPELQPVGLKLVGMPERSSSAVAWHKVDINLQTPRSPAEVRDLLLKGQENLRASERLLEVIALQAGDPLPELPRSQRAVATANLDRRNAEGKAIADDDNDALREAFRRSLAKVDQDALDLESGVEHLEKVSAADVPADKIRVRVALSLRRPLTEQELLQILEPAHGKEETSRLSAVSVSLLDPPAPPAPSAKKAQEMTLLCAVPRRDVVGNPRTDDVLQQMVISRLQSLRDLKLLDFTEPFPRLSTVGPVVASEMLSQAIFALLCSLAVIALYIWLRFQFRVSFSLGAAISLAHDTLFALAALAIADEFGYLNGQIDLTVISAFLTIIGYSINDTIVVFDRIRENMVSGRPIMEVINDSINQTLSRTVITNLCTLFVVFALLGWGGDVIRGFSWVLFIGFIAGTYSSIFIASPVIVEFVMRRGAAELSPPTPAPAVGKA